MRSGAVLTAALLAAISIGCGGGAKRTPEPSTARGVAVALYRGTITEPGSGVQRFRATLFLARPDRLHAELSGPVGGPRLIVDGDTHRIAVSLVPDRVAYVGEPGPEGLRPILGIDLAVAEFVAAMLDGTPPPTATRFERVAGGPGGWPQRVEMSADDLVLTLDLRHTHGLPNGADDAGLGTGQPAPGLEVLPFEDAPGLDLGQRLERSGP